MQSRQTKSTYFLQYLMKMSTDKMNRISLIHSYFESALFYFIKNYRWLQNFKNILNFNLTKIICFVYL